MSYQCLIVKFLMNIKAIPEIAAYHDATEAKVFGNAYIVDIHTAQRIDMAVDESMFGGILQLVRSE